MSSTRLPGKVLADVHGEPMLTLMLRRVAHARGVGSLAVATSTEPEDDAIVAAAEGVGVHVHRGPRDDVLTRFAAAAAGHPGPIVRLTADCPLMDPVVVDAVIELFRTTPGCDYAQNVDPRSYPDGLDVEVLSAGLLRRLDEEAVDPDEREHVTLALHGGMRDVNVVALPGYPELAPLRWTVDTPDDLEFVRLVVERLGERRHLAAMDEILAAIRAQPSLESFGGWRRA
jgi:spore coat polysaccharide biosynthesis protein SpsF (cytidylyltransferase family)